MNLLHSIVSPALLAAEGSNGKWLPADINEVIWGSLAFLIVATLLVKFGKAPIVNGLKARSDRIAEHLGEAAAAREAAEAERDRIKAALADSDSEAARIVEDARRAADQLGIDTAARTFFQDRHPFFKNISCRIHNPRINIARLLQAKQIRCMLTVTKYIGCRLINWHRPRTGGRIRFLPPMDHQRIWPQICWQTHETTLLFIITMSLSHTAYLGTHNN